MIESIQPMRMKSPSPPPRGGESDTQRIVFHDIHTSDRFGGAEMGGIKFHGAIDVVISHNHIYRCGNVSAIWLDWMGQGAQVTRNLVHDNTGWAGDLFLEMQRGPLLVANNIFLSSPRIYI
jgi:alpha-N-arabinofuranosidase